LGHVAAELFRAIELADLDGRDYRIAEGARAGPELTEAKKLE
jgi:hypothetical protein